MLRVLIVRPGATDFDDQGRIKGTLDIPLNAKGTTEVAETVGELTDERIEAIYASPSQCAQQTADALAADQGVRVKEIENLQNLDHGLWHGKRVEEVKQFQPKVYRQWQDDPVATCPPEGESLSAAQKRVRRALTRMLRKHPKGTIAVVVPEPLAQVVAGMLENRTVGDLWKTECKSGGFQIIDVEPARMALTG